MANSRYDKYAKPITYGGYGFTQYPTIQLNDTDFIKIVFKDGDRLDLLAKKYFKNSTFWWIIAMVNNLPGDSMFLEAGRELYIPRGHLKYVY